MKTLKYLIISLAIAFAIAGCSGGSGSYFDEVADPEVSIIPADYDE